MSEVWAVKYRPKSMNEFKGQEHITSEMSAIMNGKSNMQHYLFHSPEPGTGKTTMAEMIAHNLGWVIHKYNASSKRQRGIEFIEEEIAPMSRLGQYETIFFLDEADQLTQAAQSALKGVIEDAQGYFILTCNDLTKVSPWLQSRCNVRTFNVIEEELMLERLSTISALEGVDAPLPHLNRIVRAHSGDLRNAIGALQAYACLPTTKREQFTLSIDKPLVDAELILKLCFKEQSVDRAVSEMGPLNSLKEAIDAVFFYGIGSEAKTKSKLTLVDAATQARRDLLMGVEPHFVVWDFCRRLSSGGEVYPQIDPITI